MMHHSHKIINSGGFNMPMEQRTVDVQQVTNRIHERSKNGEFNFSFFLTFLIVILIVFSIIGKAFKFADWFSDINRHKKGR